MTEVLAAIGCIGIGAITAYGMVKLRQRSKDSRRCDVRSCDRFATEFDGVHYLCDDHYRP